MAVKPLKTYLLLDPSGSKVGAARLQTASPWRKNSDPSLMVCLGVTTITETLREKIR